MAGELVLVEEDDVSPAGLYNADGNIRAVVDDTTGTGIFAANGALRVTLGDADSPVYAPDGSLYYVGTRLSSGWLALTGSSEGGAPGSFLFDFENDTYTVNGATHASFEDYLTASGGTFTRASTGTYLNSSGVMASALSNVIRYNYIGGVRHLLIEPSRTNIIPYSEGYTTGWSIFGAGVATTGQSDPTGGTGAVEVNDDRADFTTDIRTGNITQTAIPYVGSVFILKDAIPNSTRAPALISVGNTNFLVPIDTQTGEVGVGSGTATRGAHDFNTSWWRLYMRYTQTGTANVTYRNAPARNADITNLNNANGVTGATTFFGNQLEAGDVETSYIPTTGSAATRAADALTLELPTGTWDLTFTFDDATTQTVTGQSGSYAVPTTLNRWSILKIEGAEA